MAAWQADFHVLVPTQELPSDYRAQLDSVLPAGRSWSDAIEMWGSSDGDRIDVSSEPGARPEIFARFDLRQWDQDLHRRFVSFVLAIGGALQTDDGRLVGLTLSEFEAALRSSRAARFVADPGQFLEGLPRERQP